jgi:LemA protein
MDGSVVFWFGLALLVFWAMGAYNRLVRLRSQSLLAFGLLEGLFRQYIGLVTIHLPIDAGGPASTQAQSSELAQASEHFKAMLKKARNQPLDGVLVDALKQAYAALILIQRHLDAHAWDAGQGAVERWRIQCQQVQTQIELATADFNRQIEAYNEAISEFPAILLVWLIGFKPARCL